MSFLTMVEGEDFAPSTFRGGDMDWTLAGLEKLAGAGLHGFGDSTLSAPKLSDVLAGKVKGVRASSTAPLSDAAPSSAAHGSLYDAGLAKARTAGFSGSAAHEFAVEFELAFQEAKAEATKRVGARLSSILAHPQVKGRERAALDLAIKSPAMSADDVVGFVADNVRSGSSLAARMAHEPSLGAEFGARSGDPMSEIAATIYGQRLPTK